MSLVKRLWSGRNKSTVRRLKADYLSSSEIKNPLCLSFPGSQARLEKLLVQRGLVRPNRIVGIQTPSIMGQNSGRDVLRSLFRELHRLRWDMPIFIGNFSRFPRAHRSGRYNSKVQTPYRENNYGLWRATRFGANLKFGFIDLDLCCPFNATLANTIEQLYVNNLLADRGLFIINHMKGREQVSSVQRYLRQSVDTSATRVGGDNYRFRDLPLFYSAQASRYSIALQLDKIVEYRDQNENRPSAVNMIQYFFSFENKASLKKRTDAYLSNVAKTQKIVSVVVQAHGLKTVTSPLYQKMLD